MKTNWGGIFGCSRRLLAAMLVAGVCAACAEDDTQHAPAGVPLDAGNDRRDAGPGGTTHDAALDALDGGALVDTHSPTGDGSSDSASEASPDAADDATSDGGNGAIDAGSSDATNNDSGPLSGSSCATPLELGPGAHSLDTSLFSNTYAEYAGQCAGSATRVVAEAPEAFVSVSVPSGHRLEVRATAEGANHMVTLVLLDSCARPQFDCLKAEAGAAGQPVFLEQTNSKPESQTWIVIVDGAEATRDRGVVSLEIGVLPPMCGNGRVEPGEECDDGRPPAAGDGCATTCRVEPGYACDNAVQPSACARRRHGDLCSDPFVVPGVPFSTTGDTSGAGDDLACGTGSGSGSGSPDVVYSFTPEQSGLYTIDAHSEPGNSLARYVLTDCRNPAASCLRGTGNPARLELTAGQQYYVVVDVVDGPFLPLRGGSYSLDISAPCIAGCAGKDCGDDGCGGSCGTCNSAVCSGGHCVPSPRGDRCEDPLLIDAVPYSQTNDTTLHQNQYLADTLACPGLTYDVGAGGRDVVYSFTPQTTGYYRIFVDENGWDSALYVATDCASIDSSCMAGADDRSKGGGETLTPLLSAGTTYFIFVDGAASVSDYKGPYSIDVSLACTPDCGGKVCGGDGCGGSCGTCSTGVCSLGQCGPPPPGDTCENPFPIASVPFTESGDSRLFNNQYHHPVNSCPGNRASSGAGSREVVYGFTPSTSGLYRIDVQETGWDSALYVAKDCASFGTSCVAGADSGSAGEGETVSVRLDAGTPYFVVVDGWDNEADESGPYTLDVDLACVPDCTGGACSADGCGGICGGCSNGICVDGVCTQPVPGDTCDNPFVIDAVPFAESSDSRPFTNQYSHPVNSCSGNPGTAGAGSRDLVYAFTPTTTGMYSIAVQEAGWDSTVYVTTDCTNFGASCVAGSDQGAGGEGETIAVLLSAGTTYFIVVDGWRNDADVAGAFSIEVTFSCTPNCAGRGCGDDNRCGGFCGNCPPGDTCQNPIVIADLPFSQTGDTTPLHHQYSHTARTCPGESAPASSGSRDAVYVFTPPVTRNYTISVMEAHWVAALYVATDCGFPSRSCVAAADPGYGPEQAVTLTLEAGTKYFIFVDGANDAPPLYGGYLITVTAQ